MPALNFQKRFADLVESGRKRQTIRKIRKRGNPKPGDALYLYTGMRTKSCRLLNKVTCLSVEPFRLEESEWCVSEKNTVVSLQLALGGQVMGWREGHAFAQADGLRSTEDLAHFLRTHYGLPFDGQVIHW